MDFGFDINALVEKVRNDASLKDRFLKDPIKTVEELIGMDLPDEQIKAVVEMVKAKLSGDGADGFGAVVDKVKGLFNN